MAKTQKSIPKGVEKKPKLDNPIKKKKHLKKEEKPLETTKEECKEELDYPIKKKKHLKKDEKPLQPTQGECEEAQNTAEEAEVIPNEKKIKTEKRKPHSLENGNKETIEGKLLKKHKKEILRGLNYDKNTYETIVNVPSIRMQAKSLKVQMEKYQSKNESSTCEEFQYYLRVNSLNSVNCFKKQVTIHLKNALLSKDSKVLLIVGDLQRGVDYKKTQKHYDDILKAQGVEGIKVMPLDKLYKKHIKIKDTEGIFKQYDYFLCDGRIIAKVIKLLGRSCKTSNKRFQAVYINNRHLLKKEIQKSFKRTTFNQKREATKYFIHVGNSSFSATSLAQNIVYVVHQLKKIYPGGMLNIRNLQLSTKLPGVPVVNLYSKMLEGPESGDTDEVIELKKKYLKAVERLQEVKSEICEYVGNAHKKKIAEINEKVKDHGLPETDDEDDDESSSHDDEVVKDTSDDEDNNKMVQDEDEAESETEIAGNGLEDDDDDTEESD